MIHRAAARPGVQHRVHLVLGVAHPRLETAHHVLQHGAPPTTLRRQADQPAVPYEGPDQPLHLRVRVPERLAGRRGGPNGGGKQLGAQLVAAVCLDDKAAPVQLEQRGRDVLGLQPGRLDDVRGGASAQHQRGDHPQPLRLGEQADQLSGLHGGQE